ncbi:hypothetical protein P168DRAFT_336502 [Aspergillus campestris IBT 28561]|uniref:Heterokaryon incompatibility domain-containing protein n=1 Tax=Aspergillus campestris (strain IBT 28561) TaxID=1392248 RepID=A0A2I1CSJ2_ASPC2|nr:uncharacterized protein P168DRAFT_336502 [Aspergillus campestris IBT 28561]PKY00584.1 hypothetical protein P168DRAFT_336502 [Aspergillus campestris IBT 28561]
MTISAPEAEERFSSQEDVEAILESVRQDYTIPASIPWPSDLPGEEVTSDSEESHVPELPSFTYTKLPDGNFTRVLVLKPAEDPRDELACDIQVLDLDNERHTYDAVSYVWGKPEFPGILRCGQQYLKITKSLTQALRRFRGQKSVRRLWVDAVCINQKDTDEQPAQVQAMGFIYQRARSTLIHLGEEPPGQERNMAFLVRLADLVQEYEIAQVAITRNNELIRQALHEVFGSEDKSPIGPLQAIPWFGRRWIIQEASLCRAAMTFLGRSMDTLDHITASMAALLNSGWTPEDTNQAALNNIEAIVFLSRYQKATFHPSISYSLVDLLVHCHGAECSEPRDRIYALMSVSPDVSTPHIQPGTTINPTITVIPDYTKPLADIYTDFAVQCMQQSQTFDILHCVGAFRQQTNTTSKKKLATSSQPLEVPSFVPDWTAPRRWKPLYAISRFTAGLVQHPPQRTLSNDRLTLRGIALWRVTETTGAFPESLGSSMLAHIISSCMGLCRKFLPSPERDDPNALSRKLARTLIADDTLNVALWMKDGAVKNTDELRTLRFTAEDIFSGRLDGFQKLLCQYNGGEVLGVSRSSDIKSIDQLQYLTSLRQALPGRSFFASEAGYVGIGPGDLREGDLVVVLLGARTPFILRETGHGADGHFEILGDAYVEGLMYGEVLEKPGAEYRDFVIQ